MFIKKIIQSNAYVNIIAALLLSVTFILAFSSMLGDSATMDELAHIPAGYSYVSQKDYRINPEHPPLIKDIAALPLLTQKLNFPNQCPCWTKEVNSQWWLGNEFLYHSGNNPDRIIPLARTPMIIVLIILGISIFIFAKKFFGPEVALLSLFLFSFSPNLIAHGRLVTTDIGAALGFLIATFFWLIFLKNPSKKNIVLAGITFGIAMLMKFSLILLLPFFAIITFIWPLLKNRRRGWKSSFLSLSKYIILALVIMAIGAIFVIWPIYQINMLHYPIARQASDTKTLLKSNSLTPLKNLCIWMAQKPIFRPFAHYLLGLLMATQRTVTGNTSYFMGMVSASGWWYYFPTVFALKVPLPLQILLLIALLSMAYLIKSPFWIKPWERLLEWSEKHFIELSLLIAIVIYWGVSISGHLNIGIRHILPTFPPLYILGSLGIIIWIHSIKKENFRKIAISLIIILLIWYASSSLLTWPYYLSYFNEIGGGVKNGYKYVVDSNYDWGQDLKRLKNWVDENHIDKIYVDYFGGGDTKYYLGSKWKPWTGTNPAKDFPKGNYLAVSATLLQGGMGNPVPGFNQPNGYYLWLKNYKPIARAGTSIFIYYIQ